MKTYISDLKPNIFLVEKRLKKVKYLIKRSKENLNLKLLYFPKGNLVLLKKKFFKWKILDETGPWFYL